VELSTVYSELNINVTDGESKPSVGQSLMADRRSPGAVQKLQWSTVATVHGKNLNIPEASGVYGYAEVTRVQGLPVVVRWVYIGKGLNLRRRISNGHDPRYEKNIRLRNWLRRSGRNLELWFARVDARELDIVERSLVRDIQPEFNINLK
jgi:excinuclease UvrABC nuclease subunit